MRSWGIMCPDTFIYHYFMVTVTVASATSGFPPNTDGKIDSYLRIQRKHFQILACKYWSIKYKAGNSQQKGKDVIIMLVQKPQSLLAWVSSSHPTGPQTHF